MGFDLDSGGMDQTLIEHWNGSTWRVVPSPNVAGLDNLLNGIRAQSPTDIWAVGESEPGISLATGGARPLIVHWNGSAWKQVKAPNPGGSAQNNDLMAVAVTPTGDAWAAGQFATGPGMRTLVLHLDGPAWRWESTPSLGGSAIDDTLTAVGASPDSSSIWVVGHYYNGAVEQTLVFHCC